MNIQAIALKELYKNNSKNPNKRAQNCRSFKVRYSKKNPDRYIFLVKCKETYSSTSGHIVSLKFKKDENNRYPLDADVHIKCSCPAWSYWGSDYNSTTQGYWLDTKENRYPIMRDPALSNKICKHVARVRLDLRNLTFRMLDRKKRSIIASAYNLPEVSIKECESAILKFFENNNLSIGQQFIASLNEDNFEEELLRAGIIQ